MLDISNSLILIVDDNPNNLRLLGSILSIQGFRVALAANGQECLDFVEKQIPDLIFLDIMMPDINGFDVCVKLKANLKSAIVPVIFISALSNPQQIIKAFDSGGSDYVTKPFMKEEVVARARIHIRVKREKEENIRLIDDLIERVQELEMKAK